MYMYVYWMYISYEDISGVYVHIYTAPQASVCVYIYTFKCIRMYIGCTYHIHTYPGYKYKYVPHEKLLGIQRVSTPSTENQRLLLMAHSDR